MANKGKKSSKVTVEVQQQQQQQQSVVPPKKKSRHSIKQIFIASKNTVATHPKLCLHLIKVYQKLEFEVFFSEFLDLLKVCLIVGEKHPDVERTLSFVARFTTADKRVKENKDNKENEDTGDNNAEREAADGTEKESDGIDGTEGGGTEKSQSCALDESVMAIEDEEEEEEQVDPFLVHMFQFLINNHDANCNSVRYRVCQLINRILNSMGESASLDDDVFSTIYDTMLQRLMDKRPSVRVQAILALNRLQDPRNNDCPVIKAYRYHLSMDPVSDVRRAALMSTAITFQTLPDVLQRTRDKNHLVRRQAYLVLAHKVHIRSLQISQRVRLLSEGLNDRSDMVRVTVQKNLLQAWLRFVNGNVLNLLTCLDVEASTTGAELALDTLFIDVPAATLVNNFDLLNDSKQLPYDQLKPESVLYWKCLVKHLKKESADEELDCVLPDLSAFCAYVNGFVLDDSTGEGETGGELEVVNEQDTAVKQMEKEFVLQQLVQITDCYDLSDEVGRHSLDRLVRSLLVSERVGESSINFLVDVFARLYQPNSRVHQLAEIISDVREPAPTPIPAASVAPTPQQEPPTPAGEKRIELTEQELRANKLKCAKVRVELNQLREELEDCVRSLDLDRAQELKLKLRSLEEEHEAIQRVIATPAQTPRGPADNTDATTSTTIGSDTFATPAVNVVNVEAAEIVADDLPEPQEKDDPQTLSRCLTIVCQMLKSPEINSVTPTLHSLHDNLVLPCLKDQVPLVRKLAVQALALLCLVSKELAQKHLLLFVQISLIDVEEIQVLALHSVFDFLLLYGVDQFTAASEDSEQLPGLLTQQTTDDTNALVALLIQRLESDDCEVRTAVAKGMCKLLQASRITSHALLTQLTVLWFNPITEDDNLLRHMLGVFFPLYAAYGGNNQVSLGLSVLPTLRTLAQADPHSRLAEVDVDQVACFLVRITSQDVVTRKQGKDDTEPNQDTVTNVHDSLVFTLLGEVLAYPESAVLSRHIIRVLKDLRLTPTNYANLRQLQPLLEKVVKKMRDRPLLSSLERFLRGVKEQLKQAPLKEEDEEEEEKDDVTIITRDATADENTPSTTMANKTVDSTISRKRRQLYTTSSDAEILTSEAESEVGVSTPCKKEIKVEKVEVGHPSPVTLTAGGPITCSDDDSDDDTIIRTVEEVEIQSALDADDSKCSEDMFASPDLPSTPVRLPRRSPKKSKETNQKESSKSPSKSPKKSANIISPQKSPKSTRKSPRKSSYTSPVSSPLSSVKTGRSTDDKVDLESTCDTIEDGDSTEAEEETTIDTEVSTAIENTESESDYYTPIKTKRRGGRQSSPPGTPQSPASNNVFFTASRSARTRRQRDATSPPPQTSTTKTTTKKSSIAVTSADTTTDEESILEDLPYKKRGARTRGRPSINTTPNKARKTVVSETPSSSQSSAVPSVSSRSSTRSSASRGGAADKTESSVKRRGGRQSSHTETPQSAAPSTTSLPQRVPSSTGRNPGVRRNNRGKPVPADTDDAAASSQGSTSSSLSPARPVTKKQREDNIATLVPNKRSTRLTGSPASLSSTDSPSEVFGRRSTRTAGRGAGCSDSGSSTTTSAKSARGRPRKRPAVITE